MKRIFGIAAIALSLAACKSNKSGDSEQTRVLSASDSAEFKAFQQWKAKETQKTEAQKTVVYTPATQTTVQSQPVVAKKKGWSKAAKGAVIGAGTGAIIGAVVDKNHRGTGAVVGGIIGAGTGYAIGRSKDKKSGRVRSN